MPKATTREPLVLQYRTGDGRYVFSTSAKKRPVTLGRAGAIRLVGSYPARERNCRVSGGRISLKAGHGRLPVLPEPAPDAPVRLYVGQEYMRTMSPRVFSNDEEFRATKYVPGFLERHRDTVYRIDRAVFVDYGPLKIETPYDVASADDLSTGCKTVLNILKLLESGPGPEVLVNATEAGDDVLGRVLDLVAGTRVSLYLERDSRCVDGTRRFVLNGREMTDPMQFVDAVWS